MLGYHPALDPHHTAFRILRLLAGGKRPLSRPAISILDFFLVFPETIPSIRLTRDLVPWKKRLREPRNPYWFSGDRAMVFEQMSTVLDAALRMLISAGWLRWEAEGVKRLALCELPESLVVDIQLANEAQSELMEFLTEALGELEVRGDSGLKKRTGLLEYRYDIAL